MEKNVVFADGGNVLTATLVGEIDHHSAKGQREEIDAMLFRCKPEVLVLDFSLVKFMDSSGIGLIIGRSEIACEMGIAVRLCGLNPTLKKLIRLSGVEKLKNISVG